MRSAAAASSPTFLEFFAGIGLMRLGLERGGWHPVFANDIDPNKAGIYRDNFRDAETHFELGDIHKLSASDIPGALLAAASFPCTDLSLAGAREGLAGKQSSAFWGFVRVLEQMGGRRPPLVLIENVQGFLTSNGGRDFESAMLSLNRLGYAVDPFIIDAAFFVPQSRVRIFVLGIDLKSFRGELPKQGLGAPELRPPALRKFIECHPGIRWRMAELPALPERQARLEDILEDLPPNAKQWWNRERSDYLLNQMSPSHRRTAEEMIARAEWSYGTVFRRVRGGRSMAELRTDGLAGCLRTPKGGSAKQILFKAGNGEHHVRLLTPRECARLMGADEFHISTRPGKAFFGFGDAVCVPVVEWIAKHYLNRLVQDADPQAGRPRIRPGLEIRPRANS